MAGFGCSFCHRGREAAQGSGARSTRAPAPAPSCSPPCHMPSPRPRAAGKEMQSKARTRGEAKPEPRESPGCPTGVERTFAGKTLGLSQGKAALTRGYEEAWRLQGTAPQPSAWDPPAEAPIAAPSTGCGLCRGPQAAGDRSPIAR